ncbi:MAG: molybdopterin-dependent oxidoreductase [Deltaproteobacteria bacterium]|nr:molybdopterin-dependent oxidoreductase [Deltaproteobacteria bacterium]
MEQRRQFIKTILGFFTGASLLFSPFFSLIRVGYANAKRIILPKGTRRESLTGKDPKLLDTRNLEITPLKDFDTMGETDHKIDQGKWRLEVEGRVKRPLRITYSEIMSLPSIERKVLLICPGVFANHGQWKGISMEKLLMSAVVENDATHVTFFGPKGNTEHREVFPIEEVRKEKVFLAYEINGKTLPRKHGYPLRIVAEDYHGDRWVKYVYKVSVDKL